MADLDHTPTTIAPLQPLSQLPSVTLHLRIQIEPLRCGCDVVVLMIIRGRVLPTQHASTLLVVLMMLYVARSTLFELILAISRLFLTEKYDVHV
jgi:hypothetical protein